MTRVKLTVLEAGASRGPEHAVLQNRRLSCMRFPAMFAVIDHPSHGLGLFDAGYSQRFMDLTERGPERLYRQILPVEFRAKDEPATQLRRLGADRSDVQWIFISHFHADHIGALHDFPAARFIYAREGFDALRGLNRFRALAHGFLPDLIPGNFSARSRALGKEDLKSLPSPVGPFGIGCDLFADGSVIAIPLPGHVQGHMGLVLNTSSAGPVFLVGDAAWSSDSYRNAVLPHRALHWLFDDVAMYRTSIERLQALSQTRPDIHIVPSHCQRAVAGFINEHNPTG